MQAIGIALLCMGIVSLLFFLPSLLSAFWVFSSLLSISVGVVGLLVVWGAELDPMTMIFIIMSIGFSIDFSAHFCIHYYHLKAPMPPDADHRSLGVATLQTIGWPLSQCGLSTLIAIFSLSFVGAYTMQVFFKTVALVVCLGMLHTLLILPIVLPTVSYNPACLRT